MKQLLLTTTVLCALAAASPALAADLAVYHKAPVAASPAYDWSGFYVGAVGGYAWGNQNLNNATGPAAPLANFTNNYETKGGLGGGEIGASWQSGSYLFGIEADGFGASIKGDDAFGTVPTGSNDATKLRWGASVVGRSGIALDRMLLFFEGGWAYGSLSHTSNNPGFGIDTFTATRSGWTAGGGLAYAITGNLIGKIEYRYYDFGTYRRDTPTNGVLPYTVSNTYSTLLVGLDWKFGDGPVVAKY